MNRRVKDGEHMSETEERVVPADAELLRRIAEMHEGEAQVRIRDLPESAARYEASAARLRVLADRLPALLADAARLRRVWHNTPHLAGVADYCGTYDEWRQRIDFDIASELPAGECAARAQAATEEGGK